MLQALHLNTMRALFRVTYVDDDLEELDFEELQMILANSEQNTDGR